MKTSTVQHGGNSLKDDFAFLKVYTKALEVENSQQKQLIDKLKKENASLLSTNELLKRDVRDELLP